MKLSRKVLISAKDAKTGMTSLEIRRALQGTPHQMIPRFRFKWNGTVKAIELEIKANLPDLPA
jgi:hypothetical protein